MIIMIIIKPLLIIIAIIMNFYITSFYTRQYQYQWLLLQNVQMYYLQKWGQVIAMRRFELVMQMSRNFMMIIWVAFLVLS